MSRISDAIRKTKSLGHTGFIPFLTAGFPAIDDTPKLIRGLANCGATVVELGVPFSDPLADGPTIQKSSDWALKHGTTMGGVLNCVRKAREESDIPVVLMSYVNPILSYGSQKFSRDAREAGVDGVIVSDLPPDEEKIWEEIKSSGLDSIHLVSPNSSEERVKEIVSKASGFVYCLSRFGVTGRGKQFHGGLGKKVEEIKRHTSLPVAVGFGVRNESDIRKVSGFADAVVVGAALIEALENGMKNGNGESAMMELARSLSRALSGGGSR